MATRSLVLGILLGATATAAVGYVLHLHRRTEVSRRRLLSTAALGTSLAAVGVRLLPLRSTVVPSLALAAVTLYLLVRVWALDEPATGVETDAPGRDAPTFRRANAALGGVHVPASVESTRVRGVVVALAAVTAVAVASAFAESFTVRAAITVVVAVPLGHLFGYVANRVVGPGRTEKRDG